MERCLIIPRFFLAFMIFSLRCFFKDKLESSMRPKCFCSFILATTVPLNIICGWFGLDFLQEISGLLSWVRVKFQFPLMGPLMNDVKVVIQIVCRYFRIRHHGDKHGVVSKKLDILDHSLFPIN